MPSRTCTGVCSELPDDKSVENKLKEALKGRLEAERCAATPKGNKF